MLTGMDYQQSKYNPFIAQLLGEKLPISITSNYKGIVLTQPVEVLGVKPDRVILQAPDLNVCFSVKEQVQLYSQALQEIILARLLAVNMIVGKLELADLSFPGWHWKDRQSDRVQPREPIYVRGKHMDSSMRACLDNLSVEGMSLMVYQRKTKPTTFEQDTIVRVSMQLPGDDTRLHLSGKVLHERQVGKLSLVGLRLINSSAQERHIRRYVTSRKTEILEELEQASRAYLNRQSMPGTPISYS